MKTPKLIVAIALATVAAFAAPAAAEDGGPTLTVDPPRVEEPGDITFTVTGDGWTQDALLVLPCPVPESGNLSDLTSDLCDVNDLTPVTPDEGSFETEVTYAVPEEGLVILAGDPAQNESAAAVIMVGPEEEPTPEAVDEEPEPEETVEEEPADDEVVEAEAEAELAQTGSEAGLIAVIGVTIALLGAMLVTTGRRLVLPR